MENNKKGLLQAPRAGKRLQTEKAARKKWTPEVLKRGKRQGRPRRRLTRRELVILLLPTLAAAVAVAVVLHIAGQGIRYEFPDSGHQYYAGATVAVAEGDTLFCGRDGIVRAGEDRSGEPVRVPIYLDHSPAVVLPVDMVYYDPRNGDYSRVPSLSEVLCDKDGNLFITRNGNTVQVHHGFLFDGNNFFIFLEPMQVSFNGYLLEVPALSYVEAVFGGDIMVFDYGTKGSMIEACDGSGAAETPSGDYTISLLGDSVTTLEGRKLLLVSQPSILDPIV